MKNLLTTILILSILTFQFSELLVYITFKINQDYIARNLCVEKDVEGSNCKGCCQLKKKVNTQQEQKKEFPPAQNDKQNINFFEKELKYSLNPNEKKLLLIFRNQNEYQFTAHNRIFHPPELMI